MINFIHHLLFLGVLISVLGASREEPEEDPNSFQNQLAQANEPFSLPEGLQMDFQPIRMNSLDKFQAQGVKLRIERAFNVNRSIRKELSGFDRKYEIMFDELFYSKAQDIFSEPYVTSATFLQWTNFDDEIVRRATNFPDEVEAVLTDESGNRLQLVFKVDRSHYRSPSSSVTFTKSEEAKFDISPEELEDVLNHITHRQFPPSLIYFYIEKLARENLPSFVAKIPTWRYDDWSPEFTGVQYRDSDWKMLYERKDEKTGMNLLFFEEENMGKFMEVTDPKKQRFKIASMIARKSKDPHFEIWVNKDEGAIIRLSNAMATELLLQITEAAILPTTAASVVAFLADPKSPPNIYLNLNPVRDIDLRIVQLVSKQKI